jgi:ubiquinone/menaquinone biosynthesis C-methylase UbiE
MASLRDRVRARRNGAGNGGSAPAGPEMARGPESQWFWEHYDEAASQILEAFQSEELSLSGKTIADVGCGDGFMDLGVLHKARPSKLVGYDLNLTDIDYLRRRAGEEGVDAADLGGLDFAASTATHIPADDGAFDFAFSWSAFEHVARPIEVLKEIRRILASDGAFFLQLWPFYLSSKGSHLWEWFPEDHHHLQNAESDIVEQLHASDAKPPDWTAMMSHEFQHLNRITVDELQRSMQAAGFVVRRVELLTGATRLTPELARYSWPDLAIGGIKLIATPQ